MLTHAAESYSARNPAGALKLTRAVATFLVALTLIATFTAVAQPQPQPVHRVRPRRVEGEFLVRVQPGQDPVKVGQDLVDSTPALKQANATVSPVSANFNTIKIKLAAAPAGGDHHVAQAALANHPQGVIVEPNYIYYPCEVPNDGRLDEARHLKTIDAFRAWDASLPNGGGGEIVVAVIDTGVFMDHEDLKANIWTNPHVDPALHDDHGYDFFNNDGDPSPDLVGKILDSNGAVDPDHKVYEEHGTHCAGLIAAVGNNHVGFAGVAFKANVKIMPLKFLGGPDGGGTLDNAIKAIDYAIAHNARVINASWGGGPPSQLLKEAIARANNAGILFIAAAGNGDIAGNGMDDDADPFYPANYDVPNVIAVAATRDNDALTTFSNYGRTTVHLAAPGYQVFSCVPEGDEHSTSPTSDYRPLDGTSMATPIVTGAAVLAMAHYPQLGHLDIKALLLRSVDPKPQLAGKLITGGRLNLARAVGAVDAAGQPTVTAVPAGVVPAPASLLAAAARINAAERMLQRSPFLNAPQPAASTVSTTQPTGTAHHEFVVKLAPEFPLSKVSGLVKPYALERCNVVNADDNVVTIRVASNESEQATLEKIRKDKDVLHAEPNAKYIKQR